MSSPSSTPLFSGGVQKYAWVDLGKGVCMILVVLLHVSHWFERDISHGAVGPWIHLSDFLTPLRMPLFFFISGFLATRAIRRPLRETKARTVGLYYLYIVWTLVAALRRIVLFAAGQSAWPTFIDVASGLFFPTLFWYIWALGAYFLVTKALMGVLGKNSDLALIPVFVLAAVAPFISDWSRELLQPRMDGIELGSIAANLAWFYFGVHGTTAWLAIMRKASKPKLFVFTGVYFAVYAAGFGLGVLTEVKVILAPIAIMAAAQWLSLARTTTRASRILQAVGSLTLPVYILHFFALSAAGTLIMVSGLVPVLQKNLGVSGAIVPPALTALIVWSTYKVGRIAMRAPARWMMAAPAWMLRPGHNASHRIS
ncbi:acyltransferase family protein [Arthrobacter oryzae]|uniref:acyltransferase family protein n=1 Tax=Arthrobacter oryzae TaxID=409290 RepID=UPI00273C109E|nr:acyltransferase [Arthrobacter oryzae]WLQ07115.1 acyltransferase [Arthrobacter oryzae]